MNYKLILVFSVLSVSVQAEAPASIGESVGQAMGGDKITGAFGKIERSRQQTQKALQDAKKISQHGAPLKDPTQVNGDFKAVLRDLKSGNQGKAAQAPQFKIPRIKLLARLKPQHKKTAVLLEVEGRKMILNRGDHASFNQGDQIKEIHIDDLTDSLLELRIMPDDKTIRLR